ncbi:MAG: methyltransferase domain-containing protein [Patescibacteria group bacterium]
MPYETVMFNVLNILQRAGVKRGDVIADLGTGREGRMALASSNIIGEDGIAYAVDIVKSILPALQTKAAIHGIKNMQTVWSDLEIYGATKAISDNSLDVGFLVTTLFQSKRHGDMVRESIRMIKPTGKLVVVDWKSDQKSPLGPPIDMRVSPNQIKEICQELGLKLIDEFEAGQCHWGLIFEK